MTSTNNAGRRTRLNSLGVPPPPPALSGTVVHRWSHPVGGAETEAEPRAGEPPPGAGAPQLQEDFETAKKKGLVTPLRSRCLMGPGELRSIRHPPWGGTYCTKNPPKSHQSSWTALLGPVPTIILLLWRL